MPATLHPYLNFDGNCGEAMRFYAGVLGVNAEILTFAQSPMPAPPGAENRVMHATVRSGSLVLMASDTMPEHPFVQGTNVHLSLNFTDRDEQTRVFEGLAAGGRVDMPLADQFWGRFGMLTDRFGVHWMVNMEAPHGAGQPG